MKATTLKTAIAEAQRFIDLAEDVPMHDIVVEGTFTKNTVTYIESGKASGAARRASMDLSRCLSDLRQGR